MVSKTFVEFSASHRVLPEGATRIADVSPNEAIEVSVYLKPREIAATIDPALSSGGRRAILDAARGEQHKDDIQLIRDFAGEHGLTVTAVEPGRRLVKLSGSATQMQEAFSTQLAIYEHNSEQFRGRSGALKLPQDVEPIVEAVLGLDNRRAADPHFVLHGEMTPQSVVAHRPNAVGQLYGYPSTLTGAGQCIALIELGGGYLASDNAAAFAAMGLTPPTVLAVSVDGGANAPGAPADGEVALDIQVAGGAAPGAKVAVYFAPNTFQGFVDAISTAAHDATNTPTVISISWGSPEANWSQQSYQAMNSAMQDAANLGVSVFVAAGDHLGTDNLNNGKANVDFPASSPWAVGCGGTTIDTNGGAIDSEVVWNQNATGWGTGGGISDIFPVPAFQSEVSLPPSVNDGGHRRGVPDVAGDADNRSGYLIVLHGATSTIGGTSAVAPLWAGLTALLNQTATGPLGFFLPKLYKNPSALRDITQGDNKPLNSNLGYNAGPGWDACTGWGVPVGGSLLKLFTGWPAGRTINNADSTPYPLATAVFQNQLFILWRANDPSNRMYVSRSSDGASWPNGHTINNADSTPFSPAVCVFQNKLYALWRANDASSTLYWSASSDGVSWPSGTRINNNDSTPLAPSCCVFQNKLYAFWTANDNSHTIFVSGSADGATWPAGHRINNVDSTPLSPAACVFHNKLYLFWRANDSSNTLYYSASSDGVSWPNGARINQNDSSTDAPAACVIDGKLFLIWKANDPSNTIYVTASSDGIAWPPGRRINDGDSTPASPNLCAFGTALFGIWKANDSSNRIYFSRNGGPNA